MVRELRLYVENLLREACSVADGSEAAFEEVLRPVALMPWVTLAAFRPHASAPLDVRSFGADSQIGELLRRLETPDSFVGDARWLVISEERSGATYWFGIEGGISPPPLVGHPFFERSLEAMYRSTPEGVLVEANAAMARLLGYASREAAVVRVQHTRELFEEPEARGCWLERLESEGAIEEVSMRLRRADGVVRSILERAWVVRDAEGRTRFLEGVLRDVTEKEKLDRTVRELVEGAFARADDGFFPAIVTDLAANLGLERVLVARLDEEGRGLFSIASWTEGRVGTESLHVGLEGTPLEALLEDVGGAHCHPTGVQQAFPRDPTLVESGFDSYVGVALRGADGTSRGALVGWGREPIADPDFVSTVFELFAHRAAAELERQEMERHVRDLRAYGEKLRLQLFQAQKTEAIGRLAGGVAHDFNNLFQAVMGHLELLGLRYGAGAPGLEAEIENLLDVVEHGSETARKLLLTARKAPTESRVVDLDAVVRSQEEVSRSALGERVELVLQLGEDLPGVHADEGQIQQVVLNLLLNARDAMPDGGRITIRTSRSERRTDAGPQPTVRLEIADTGVGIPASIRDRILEPFFSTKREEQGHGLGLAVVHGIVEEHRGTIAFDSEVGRGTRVTVELPVADGRPVALARDRGRPHGEGQTVLVAEDDSGVRELIRRDLEHAGYRVLLARDGGEAVEIFANRRREVAAVVLDLRMPHVDGPEALRRMRDVGSGPPALLITGAGEEVSTAVPDDVAVLLKPFRSSELLRRIRELVRESPGTVS